MRTLGDAKAEVGRWIRENVPDEMLTDAVNDANNNLYNSIMLVAVGNLVGGPVNLTIAAAAERVNLVSIPDPTVAPVPVQVAQVNALGNRNVFVAYSLVTDSGSETLLSPVAQSVVAAPNLLVQCPAPAYVPGAIGWNCYMGSTAALIAKQNADPLDFYFGAAAGSYTEDVGGNMDAPDRPSPPSANGTGDNIAYIRHLESQQPDGRLIAWNQADFDSLAMRRAAFTIASTSPAQTYAWDLINDSQLEIRPAAGAGIVPRYFYVTKPRRLNFNKSVLPFTSVDPSLFIKCFALSLLQLAAHEYESSQAWSEKADKERQAIMLVYNKRTYAKNNRVTPFMK